MGQCINDKLAIALATEGHLIMHIIELKQDELIVHASMPIDNTNNTCVPACRSDASPQRWWPFTHTPTCNVRLH